jgi:hypothetical protein
VATGLLKREGDRNRRWPSTNLIDATAYVTVTARRRLGAEERIVFVVDSPSSRTTFTAGAIGSPQVRRPRRGGALECGDPQAGQQLLALGYELGSL